VEKKSKLEQIVKEIESCGECKLGKSGIAVPGEGNPNADIVFIGEAPGKTEAQFGRPFIGRSGKLLRSKIEEMGLDAQKVYITSPVKYLPDRGTPSNKDISHGRIHLTKQLEVIQPKLIVLLGSTAVSALLSDELNVTLNHGKLIEEKGSTVKYFITVHPAAAMRFPKLRKMMDEDFKKLESII
jgi:uracil-DNA glycosylase